MGEQDGDLSALGFHPRPPNLRAAQGIAGAVSTVLRNTLFSGLAE